MNAVTWEFQGMMLSGLPRKRFQELRNYVCAWEIDMNIKGIVYVDTHSFASFTTK